MNTSSILQRLKNRYFVTHLAGSLLAITIIFLALRFYWYPNVFFNFAGGIDGFKILLGVDMVLGPALTLFFFTNRKKPPVKDFFVILAIQLTSLTYGLYVIYEQKPLAVVHIENNAYTVNKNTFKANELPLPNFDNIPGPYPKSITIPAPTAAEERKAFYRSQLSEGLLQARENLYSPTSKSLDEIKRHGESIANLVERLKLNGSELENFNAATYADSNYLTFRLITGHRLAFAIIDSRNGNIVSAYKVKSIEIVSD